GIGVRAETALGGGRKHMHQGRETADKRNGHLQKRVEQALRLLTKRQQHVLRMRFGIGVPAHRACIVSRQLGVTSQRLFYLETLALGTLRAYAIGGGQLGRAPRRERTRALRRSTPAR